MRLGALTIEMLFGAEPAQVSLLSLLQCELGGSPAPAPAEGGGGGLLPHSPGALDTCGGGGPPGSEFGLGAALGAALGPRQHLGNINQ